MTKNYTIKEIIDKAKKNKRWADTKLIQRAYNYALLKHGDQKRKSGEPYIIHPTNVAYTIAELGLDEQTISAISVPNSFSISSYPASVSSTTSCNKIGRAHV